MHPGKPEGDISPGNIRHTVHVTLLSAMAAQLCKWIEGIGQNEDSK